MTKYSADIELFGKHYRPLKKYAFNLAAKKNLVQEHQDLLHDCIHSYLSHKDKKLIVDPVAWIKVKLYKEIWMPNSSFTSKYIKPIKLTTELHEGLCKANAPVESMAIQHAIAKHFMSDFHYVERTLLSMKLNGYNNVEISEIFNLPYDTVCRFVNKSIKELADKVKKN